MHLKIKKLLRRSSLLAPLLVLLTNLLAYYGTHIINSGRRYNSVILNFDKNIPFVPAFIIIYVLAFVQWAVCYITIAVEDKSKVYYFCAGAAVANLICAAVFIIYPTAMTIRPRVYGKGFINSLARFIFSMDTPPVNLLPSIHCLESYLSIRILFASSVTPKAVKWMNAAFSVAVFASVLFVKQHAVVDIPAGILAAEVGLLLTRALKIDKRLIKLENRILSA